MVEGCYCIKHWLRRQRGALEHSQIGSISWLWSSVRKDAKKGHCEL